MSKTILVVDDSISIRLVVAQTLRAAGFTVIEAEDGVDALEKCNGQKLHLVISDLNMPRMDGINFVREMKQLPAYRFTPAIILTTETAEDKIAEGHAAGAKTWMIKPFKAERMLAVVSKILFT